MSILRLKKQEKYFNLPIKPFVYGIKKAKSVLLGLHQDTDGIITETVRILLLALLVLVKSKKSVIVGFLPKNKWTTLNDKKVTSSRDILITSLLQTSVLELTGKEKALKPFWTWQCKEISRKLWCPTETVSAGSLSNFWNGSSYNVKSNSWFSIARKDNPQTLNSQMIFSPSYMYIPVDKWEKEGIVARKIRLYPTLKQKRVMRKWMGTRRYVYNRALSTIKTQEKPDKYKLRNELVIAKNNPNVQEWELETPKDIRAGAIRDLFKNRKSALSNLRNGNISKFKLGYCRKKDNPSIEIPKRAIKLKSNGIFIYSSKKYLPTKIKIAKRDNYKFKIEYDCRLQISNGNWFLVAPINIKVKKPTENRSWCALDPGIRSFQTVYSEEMVLQFKVHKESVKKLQRKIDLFRSLRSKKQIKSRRKKYREQKCWKKMDNLIDDLHHKTIRFLTDTYNHIIIPTFESQEMSIKCRVRTRNRDLLQLKHFLFRQRLASKCKLRHCTLDVCTEEYTSQTCGRCGCLQKMGGKDIYNCRKCGLVIDRDVNGARNIAIKRKNET